MKFRKKSVVVEAEQWLSGEVVRLQAFCTHWKPTILPPQALAAPEAEKEE